MAFEQYFYEPNPQFTLGSETTWELNAYGPYRKPKGGVVLTGSAEEEIKKRKFYTVEYTGNVKLKMPIVNGYGGQFSGTKIIKRTLVPQECI